MHAGRACVGKSLFLINPHVPCCSWMRYTFLQHGVSWNDESSSNHSMPFSMRKILVMLWWQFLNCTINETKLHPSTWSSLQRSSQIVVIISNKEYSNQRRSQIIRGSKLVWRGRCDGELRRDTIDVAFFFNSPFFFYGPSSTPLMP